MKNNKSSNTNYPPLLCWDIFMEGFYKRMQLADDLRGLEKLMVENDWNLESFSPDNALVWQDKVILITDASFNIIYVTRNIFDMNGYRPYEVIGNNPRMFQGEETTLEERKIIKIAVDNLQPFDTVITNYKKDGATYKCHIEGYPIFDRSGKLVNFGAHEKVA